MTCNDFYKLKSIHEINGFIFKVRYFTRPELYEVYINETFIGFVDFWQGTFSIYKETYNKFYKICNVESDQNDRIKCEQERESSLSFSTLLFQTII